MSPPCTSSPTLKWVQRTDNVTHAKLNRGALAVRQMSRGFLDLLHVDSDLYSVVRSVTLVDSVVATHKVPATEDVAREVVPSAGKVQRSTTVVALDSESSVARAGAVGNAARAATHVVLKRAAAQPATIERC
jgi:hypothetical protein